MRSPKSKFEFVALFTFLIGLGIVLTNGFSARIFAQEEDIYERISPISEVLSHILNDYVYQPDVDKAVEGALIGILNSLDRNSGYISPQGFKMMQEDTEGVFDGIGVIIKSDEEGRIFVWQPVPDGPAAKAGIRTGDIITKIDGVSTDGMNTAQAAQRIKGPRGQEVQLSVLRPIGDQGEYKELEFKVKRGKIPLESIVEARLIDGTIGYVRISDFKKNTAKDVKERVEKFLDEGMQSLILDLRWNPGGLLSSSKEVCELFLPRNSLVTSTRGRQREDGRYREDMVLYTEKDPIVPPTMPIVVLVSGTSASSSEIVTGALQFHKRALIVGEKTFGKGSVQTIIPLTRPKGSAVRLTTALYYTPADVTIDRVGILPDVEVPMSSEAQDALQLQMYKSFEANAELRNSQNHGTVTGNTTGAEGDEIVEDVVLKKAVEMLKEDPVWENLVQKYHRDIKETQVAAQKAAIDEKKDVDLSEVH